MIANSHRVVQAGKQKKEKKKKKRKKERLYKIVLIVQALLVEVVQNGTISSIS